MGTFDIILLILFFSFVGAGFYFGLIHTLGALLGVVVGILAASNLYVEVAPFFEFFMIKEQVALVLSFIAVFLIVSRLIGYVMHMFDKGFKIIRFIPFATSINRLGGALIGFFEGALVLGTILFIASHFQLSSYLDQAISSSPFAGLLMSIAKIVTPLVPDIISVDIPI